MARDEDEVDSVLVSDEVDLRARRGRDEDPAAVVSKGLFL
jgi:hypothetical protein